MKFLPASLSRVFSQPVRPSAIPRSSAPLITPAPQTFEGRLSSALGAARGPSVGGRIRPLDGLGSGQIIGTPTPPNPSVGAISSYPAGNSALSGTGPTARARAPLAVSGGGTILGGAPAGVIPSNVTGNSALGSNATASASARCRAWRHHPRRHPWRRDSPESARYVEPWRQRQRAYQAAAARQLRRWSNHWNAERSIGLDRFAPEWQLGPPWSIAAESRRCDGAREEAAHG